MLEMFFDNEKSFSVLKFLLESDKEKLLPSDIGVGVNIAPRQLRRIIDNFEILDIVRYDFPFITLNLESSILQGICVLDEFVEKKYMDRPTNEGKKENGCFQQKYEEGLSKTMSLNDFVEFLKDMEI
jgi:hypothetical protein